MYLDNRLGRTFLSSKEDSNESHTSSIFSSMLTSALRIGLKNVIQVLKDNTSNSITTASLMLTKSLNLFWTSYASHTLNPMLERVGKSYLLLNSIVYYILECYILIKTTLSHSYLVRQNRRISKEWLIEPNCLSSSCMQITRH